MEKLRVIGTEDGALVLATESGQRFSLPVDEVLRAELRRTQRREPQERAARPSPREIQAQIRAGLSAAEAAQLLGISVEDVVRFEAPVLAEREYVVGQALAVPVLLGTEIDHDLSSTFGAAVRAKLADAGAIGERWTSWKEESGWVVKLEFTSADVDHDARWSFDPRHSSLAPLNPDATQLSRPGTLPEGLIPRLRALEVSGTKDDSRFDSGAFGMRRTAEVEPITAPTSSPAAQDAAIKRAPETPVASTDTADLLEALRRRRGQREPMPNGEPERATAAAPVALFDALEPGYDDAPGGDAVLGELAEHDDPLAFVDDTVVVAEHTTDNGRRRGRPAMPSWDEIVFGARTDES
ncbi:septation protein SepH [Microbacterium sp. X-17]|uniref:septation protein SepH n=1 Tax=Microbacterium sp. X-17 TaxID=3144404 RepID=UPI0031F52CFD